MQAVILAAGMGKRLKYLTKDNTKCMVKVNGVTLIERMLRQLDKINLDRIIIVVGYEGEKLVKYIESIHVTTSVIFVKSVGCPASFSRSWIVHREQTMARSLSCSVVSL